MVDKKECRKEKKKENLFGENKKGRTFANRKW